MVKSKTKVISYADGSRIAYVVKVGSLYWTRDRARGKKRKRGQRATNYKDFLRAGIITTRNLAVRIARDHKGKIVPVKISV